MLKSACSRLRRRRRGRTAGAAASRTATTIWSTLASALTGAGDGNADSAAKKPATVASRPLSGFALERSPDNGFSTPLAYLPPRTFLGQLTADILDGEASRHATDLGRLRILEVVRRHALWSLRGALNRVCSALPSEPLPRRRVLGRGASL